MLYRTLGKTALKVSALSFGAGPVSGWLKLPAREQCDVVAAAVAHGINWFDTAATYGDGLSEQSLGAALNGLDSPLPCHLGTKVRIMPDQLDHVAGAIQRSVEASLRRLQCETVTLLQLHNSVTHQRGDEPTSLCLGDVLDPGGVLETMDRLRQAGKVQHLGLTGIGQAAVLRQLLETDAWSTMQIPFHLLNPSAGYLMPVDFPETNYGGLLNDCGRRGVGTFAIRVFAAGALAGRPPSEHTQRTPFFPLALYQRDQARAARAGSWLESPATLPAAALRFALDHPAVSSALIGFATVHEIERVVEWLQAPPLPRALRDWALAGAPCEMPREIDVKREQPDDAGSS
jgi:aryl-alcohol dehydrogenase-like predicted oxidoreductase